MLYEEDFTMAFTKVYDSLEAARTELQCRMEGNSNHFGSCIKEFETFDYETAAGYVTLAMRAKMLLCELNLMEMEGRTGGHVTDPSDVSFSVAIQIQDDGSISIMEQGDS